MLLPRRICDSTQVVWDGHDLSSCFEDMFLGVGGDLITLTLISHYLTRRCQNTGNSRRSGLVGARALEFLFAAAAGISFFIFVQFLYEGHTTASNNVHFLLHISIRLVAWVCVFLVIYSNHDNITDQGWHVCVWLILRPVLDLPSLRSNLMLEGWSVHYFEELVLFSVSLTSSIMLSRSYIYQYLHKRRDKSLVEPLIEPKALDQTPMNMQVTISRSAWSFLSFSWVNSLMETGFKQQLCQDDLLTLPKDLIPSTCGDRLWAFWMVEQTKGADASLFRAIFQAYGWKYLQIGLLKIVNDALSFSGPLLLNAVVSSVQYGSSSSYYYGYWAALGLGAVSSVRALLGTQYTFYISKIKLQLRASITTVVYRKALCVKIAERSGFSTGEIQTFMSVDAERIVNLCSSFHDLWSLPLQMAIVLCMLYLQVKFAFLAGLSVVILLIPVNKWIAERISAANQLMMKEKDERVRRMNELLTYIRTLKMYAWETNFAKRVIQIRKQELKYLAVRKYLDALCVYFWACTPTLFSLFTFGLYALLGYSLDAATVFTSLALFNILLAPLNSFPWVINGVIEAFISIKRVHKFLLCPNYDVDWTKEMTMSPLKISSHSTTKYASEMGKGMAISITDADFTWSNSAKKSPLLTLKNISLKIPRGALVLLLGKVGSGKTSLFQAILGQMHQVRGNIEVDGSVAFVAQLPWIQSGTIRHNVLFGQAYDHERYNEVLQACALDVDIAQMKGGDSREVGENGYNLSGGQKARLALARALYKDCEIYLLDDPLSAVDAHVAAWLLQHAIQGPLMAQKTRILCTHHIEALPLANLVVVMENGHIQFVGSPDSLGTSNLNPQSFKEGQFKFEGCSDREAAHLNTTMYKDIKDLVDRTIKNKDFEGHSVLQDTGICITENSGQGVRQSQVMLIPNMADNEELLNWAIPTEIQGDILDTISNTIDLPALPVSTEIVPLVEEEERKEGQVEAAVYWTYAAFCGWFTLGVIFVSATLMQASRNGNDWWLAHWVDDNFRKHKEKTVYFYLEVLVIIACCNSIFTLARAFSYAYGGLRAAFHVHEKLLQNIIKAPVSFFDQNPKGRILNRFSSDLYAVDDSLPFTANNLLANVFGLLGITTILCFVQKYYRATSRELRRLDSVSRSSVYTSFTEALDGAPTIQAYKSQALFSANNSACVEVNQKASFSEIAASLWLSIRLQMLASTIILFISIMALVGNHSNLPGGSTTAGLMGLALSYATPIISLLSDMLSNFTETEKEMVSVERVRQYISIEGEPLEGDMDLGANWPTAGIVEFCHATLVYKKGLPPALDGISFVVQGGEHVGIAGRTGAGKSSILAALFRLTPLTNGRILIDNIDTARIALHRLRSNLKIVPQNPFLFEGTVRENLNSNGDIGDCDLWKMLEKCHLKDIVKGAGGLDAHILEGGDSLSLGQRQLLSLARSLLESTKILCLDECTSNIDLGMASLLKETIASECQNMTVITIAHRISTISDLDRVIILDRGKLVEQGPPKVLLTDPTSKFSGLARASTL
ncbi:hypothetical protein O6H91_21G014900 [Diphasiastrum complanatum]|uniref:Uncharacterized protein n=3 Tax=Diphasiastrum complanatum TaxID=34168 RepID=A0ACC2AJZ0_DIPCM|nr:hypothetical protein O6H91_21G014900 [Diphasiastrum complanatum]KAJ7517218.1 hypothetical protein O6H91_21G014900 [Diphasiastrum complanatum]KAJ7517224.1 hypothetical protein O6H91_21G014900 [Diphasiastrum complanatum]